MATRDGMVLWHGIYIPEDIRMNAVRELFESKVEMVTESGCWIWMPRRMRGNYGGFKLSGKEMTAHRASWIIYHGPIPAGLCILHRCDTPLCVNPNHIYPGTQSTNIIEAFRKKRKTFPNCQDHPNAKLSNSDVVAIRIDTRLHRVIGEEYGISRANVGDIKNNRTWKNLASEDKS